MKTLFLVSNYLKLYAISYDSFQDENFFALASQSLDYGSGFISLTEKECIFVGSQNQNFSSCFAVIVKAAIILTMFIFKCDQEEKQVYN